MQSGLGECMIGRGQLAYPSQHYARSAKTDLSVFWLLALSNQSCPGNGCLSQGGRTDLDQQHLVDQEKPPAVDEDDLRGGDEGHVPNLG